MQALVDLGWGHEVLATGTVRDVLDAGRGVYAAR
jgi:hypothetical protein